MSAPVLPTPAKEALHRAKHAMRETKGGLPRFADVVDARAVRAVDDEEFCGFGPCEAGVRWLRSDLAIEVMNELSVRLTGASLARQEALAELTRLRAVLAAIAALQTEEPKEETDPRDLGIPRAEIDTYELAWSNATRAALWHASRLAQKGLVTP